MKSAVIRERSDGGGDRQPSITIVVPALNEEGNLEGTIARILSSVGTRRIEILVFNDGSTDGTGALAEALAVRCGHIRVIHHERSGGLGCCYSQGVKLATCEYVVMVPGDNEIPGEALKLMFDRLGTVDIVAPYFTNASIRPWNRRFLSGAFTGLVNGLFRLRLRYFNGPCIHRRELALSALPDTSGFAYMAVLLVRLIASGHSVAEVGIPLGERPSGRSKAFRLKNFMSVGVSLLSLFVEIRILRRRWRAAVPASS